MAMIRRSVRFSAGFSVSFLAAVSVGLVSPTVAYGVEANSSNVNRAEVDHSEILDSQAVTRVDIASVDIEECLEPIDGRIDFEQTFSGNANEIIVIYTEGEGGVPVYSMGYGGSLFILDPDGESVFLEFDYPTGIDLADEGSYFTVRLPKTGEYRVIFEDGPIPVDDEYVASGRLLQVRASTYYERLLMSAETMVLDDRADEGLDLLALAIEQNQDLPAAYISRVFIYADKIFNTPDFNEKLEWLENSETGVDERMFEIVYDTFSSQDPALQSLLINDIRQIAVAYQAASAQGEANPDFFGSSGVAVAHTRCSV